MQFGLILAFVRDTVFPSAGGGSRRTATCNRLVDEVLRLMHIHRSDCAHVETVRITSDIARRKEKTFYRTYTYGTRVDMKKYLVLDDLAAQLVDRPMYVPIPDAVFVDTNTSSAMNKFVRDVLKRLFRLPYWTWFHDLSDVKLDGFTVRMNNIYPNFST